MNKDSQKQGGKKAVKSFDKKAFIKAAEKVQEIVKKEQSTQNAKHIYNSP